MTLAGKCAIFQLHCTVEVQSKPPCRSSTVLSPAIPNTMTPHTVNKDSRIWVASKVQTVVKPPRESKVSQLAYLEISQLSPAGPASLKTLAQHRIMVSPTEIPKVPVCYIQYIDETRVARRCKTQCCLGWQPTGRSSTV